MVTCLNAMGKKVTYEQVLDRFHRIDKDGNHEVDYEGQYEQPICQFLYIILLVIIVKWVWML